MPNKKTTRRTSAAPVKAKIKPSKTKKVKKPTHKQRTGKTRVGKGLTAVLNTYKTVKRKIVPPKETRTANRTARQEKSVIKRVPAKVYRSEADPVRTVGVGAIEQELNYPINPVTRKRDYDGATDGSYLAQEKTEDEFVMTTKTRKDYTWLYILLAAVVILFITKQKK